MALMKKEGTLTHKKLKYKKPINNKLVEKFIKDNINIDNYYLYNNENNYYMSLMPILNIDNGILRCCVYLGELKKDRFEPSHSLYRTNRLDFKYKYDLSDEEYLKFISGEELSVNLDNHYYQVTYKDLPLGFGKCSNNQLKNKYPKGLRRMV